MGKKKEWFMDYATHAFVRFANLGCPTRESYEERIRNDCYRRFAFRDPSFIVIKAEAEISARKPLMEDIDAVNRVFDILKKANKEYIAEAVKAVYFVNPNGKPDHGVIVERVTAFAMKCPASTRTVYEWLKSARVLFCKERGLNIGNSDEKW